MVGVKCFWMWEACNCALLTGHLQASISRMQEQAKAVVVKFKGLRDAGRQPRSEQGAWEGVSPAAKQVGVSR